MPIRVRSAMMRVSAAFLIKSLLSLVGLVLCLDLLFRGKGDLL
jgi:hypothetical protein